MSYSGTMPGKSHWSQQTFVAVDVEGNGRQPPDLVELAVVTIMNGDVQLPPTQWLIRPCESITWQAKRIHGITNRDVQGRPAFEEISGAVQEALALHPIVGHRVSVDCRLLQLRMPTWKRPVTFDTWKIAKQVVPGLESYSLSALVLELRLGCLLEGRPHRAAYDALAAAHLFVTLVNMLDSNGNLTTGDLARLSDCTGKDYALDEPQGSLF